MHDTSTLETLGDHCRRLSVVVVTICCAGTIAACGSSSKSETTIASNGNSQGIKFAACMRAHGVPDFADPTGGGIQGTAGSGVDPASPAFKTAQQHCQALLPSGQGPGQATSEQAARALALTRCMRAHRVSGFPDPTSSQPSITSGAYSVIWGRPGAYVAVPITIDMQSPTFRQAATACKAPF